MATLIRPVSGDADRFRREMDSLFQSFLQAEASSSSSPVWSPRADIVETEDVYHVDLDLPGVDRDSLELTLDDGVLKINGERSLREEHRDGRFHRVERSYGRFSRSFRLGPDVDSDTVEASFDDGVLHVSVRKAEQAKPRRIEVRSGAPGRLSSSGGAQNGSTEAADAQATDASEGSEA